MKKTIKTGTRLLRDFAIIIGIVLIFTFNACDFFLEDDSEDTNGDTYTNGDDISNGTNGDDVSNGTNSTEDFEYYMNNNFPGLLVAYSVSEGSSPINLDQFPRVKQWLDSRAVTNKEKNYYGADLTRFPPAAREFIMNTQFTQERMEVVSRLNHTLETWWSDDNNAVLMRATYTIAPGYVGAGTIRTWGENARYRGSSTIWERYGEYAKFQTLRFRWDFTQLVEHLLRHDPMFAEIIEFAMQLSYEIEYDWENYSGYTGTVIPTPDKTYAVCDGYAKEVTERALGLSSVAAVERWTAPNHAWNVLELIDGRRLFFDLTWFDNEHINEETGAIYQTDDYGWANITFFEELFHYSNISYGSGLFLHSVGVLASRVEK